PRRCLRGCQATTGSGSLCRHGTLVRAAARGPVSTAAATPSPSDCPAGRWAARRCSDPRRLGNALAWTLRLASPPCPPGGTHGRYRRRAALPVPLVLAAPHPPGHWQTAAAGLCVPKTGGARACLTRCRRGLAGSVVAACPHTPRRSLRSAVGRTVFD